MLTSGPNDVMVKALMGSMLNKTKLTGPRCELKAWAKPDAPRPWLNLR
jgi:hypothetical protein